MKKNITGVERRYFEEGLKIETREGLDKQRHIVGYALKFNVLSNDLGGFRERISPDAMKGVDITDVVALFNHDKNLILARTLADTLKLTIDETGLKYEFDSPDTTAGNDLLVSVDRGDVRGSSFAFSVDYSKVGDTWEKDETGMYIRTIVDFKRIIDVSPVVWPAYPDAEVGKRSMEEFVRESNPKPRNLEVTKTLIEMYRK